MEIVVELLVALLQFVAEVVLQVVFEGLAELGVRGITAPFRGRPTRAWLAGVGYTLLGAAAGGLSLLIFPSSFIHDPRLRIINLGLTPIAAGAAMALLGAWRRRRGQALVRLDRFAYGFVFAFAMALVRLVGAR